MAANDVALRTLSLFSGVGGLDLGVRLACPTARTVCYVEREIYCASVLAARMADGHLDPAPIWSDVTTFDARRWRGAVDLVIGGPPCQPISVAGRGRGQSDERWLWDDTLRVVAECQPTLVFFENPGVFLRRGFQGIGERLCALGYRIEAGLWSALEAGAPHLRERLFILGVADASRQRRQQIAGGALGDEGADGWRAHGDYVATGDGADVGDTSGGRYDGRAPEPLRRPPGRVVAEWSGESLWCLPDTKGTGLEERGRTSGASAEIAGPERGGIPVFPPARTGADEQWRAILRERPDLAPTVEPGVRRVADGLAGGMDRPVDAYRLKRIRAVGNGVVSLTAALALRQLMTQQEIQQ